MANLLRTLTRKQLTNRNISSLSHRNPFFSSGSSLDPNFSSGFCLGIGLNPGNEGFKVNEKVTHLKSWGLNPFFLAGSSSDPNLPSGFGLFGNGVGLNPSNEGFRVNEKVTHLKSLSLDPFFSSGSFSHPSLPSGFASSQGENKCGDGVGSSDKGLKVNEKVTHLKRCGLDPFLSSGSFLDPGLTNGFGLSQVIGSWVDDVEDSGMMRADSVKKKRKKKMNKHKYKKLRKRLRRKTKT